MFEGKDCSFLVVVVCEASVFFFLAILSGLLFCVNILKALIQTHLRNPRELRHSLYVSGYGLGEKINKKSSMKGEEVLNFC